MNHFTSLRFKPRQVRGLQTFSPNLLRLNCPTMTNTCVDISVIALWLGHESPTTTQQYVEADLAMKERALARLQEPKEKLRRYSAPDSLIEFLKTL